VSTGRANSAADVLAFWRAAGAAKWFKKNAAFDAEIASRFQVLWRDAAAGVLADWEAAPEPALSLVLVLDQFPRNVFRSKAEAFATDALARGVAERAIARGLIRKSRRPSACSSISPSSTPKTSPTRSAPSRL